MTADMPDAVIVAREAVAHRYEGYPEYAAEAAAIRAGKQDQWNDVSLAILGARAMQDAMAGRVRVKPMDLSNVLNAAFNFGLSGGKWEDFSLDAHPGYRRILSTLEPAGAQEGATCKKCQGNGEIVTDWRRYESPRDGDAGDEAVIECPECDGTGRTPTPAPDVPGLVATLRRGTGIRESVLYTEADAHAADCTMKEAAAALEALQAEVAKRDRIASDLQALCDRQAIELGALRSEQTDLRYEIMEGRPDPGLATGNFIEMVRMLHGAQKGGLARATAAEAERDALRAEVERLRVIVGRFYQSNDEGKLCDEIDNDGSHYPSKFLDDTLNMAAAALAPAKAGG